MSTIAGADFDYVVVGAGPAGLAAAGHLAKGGHKVAIFDFRPRPENVFGSYPVVLNPRGLQALERLDPALVTKANEIGMDVKELHIVPDNRTVAQVKTFGTGIMRDQASQILLEHCETRDTIKFFWEHKLEEANLEAHSLTFTTADGSKVTLTDIRQLVAADGNRSRIRRACAAQVPDFTAEELPWGFQLRFMNSKAGLQQTEVNKDFHYVLGDKGYVCQQPNGVWSVSLRVLPGVDEDFLTADDATEERVTKLREYTEKYAGFVAKHLLTEEDYKGFYNCRAFGGLVVKCSCLNPAGWIVIIGDACHAVQPATGEGINSGLEDASILGQCVAEHPDDPFAAYDRLHRADAHALQLLALQARDKVVASPRQKVSNVMVTIGLGIAKRTGIIEGTIQDFMLGELAKTVGVKSYAELVEMEGRQSRGLKTFANGVCKVLRISKESPLDQVKQDVSDGSDGERPMAKPADSASGS
mmetsp:Transcript_82482/g.237141  ORF Transcript_82482/g.237141 Transcript_82482/m.237141 type:complete len:472 (-) Transcript_82482:21-1436(-)